MKDRRRFSAGKRREGRVKDVSKSHIRRQNRAEASTHKVA